MARKARKDERLAREGRIAAEKWQQYFKYNIDEYHRLHTFVLGRQWNEDEEDALKTFKKIPLQFNKLATLINSLLGEQQQNTPQLEVVPLSNCDEETISLRQMIVKDIMLSTDARTVYQIAAAQAFVGGFGAFMWTHDYENNRSFNQVPIPKSFKDSSACYWDLGAELTDKTDGLCCGYKQRLTWKKFRQIFGKEIEKKVRGDMKIVASKEEVALAVQPDLTEDPFSWADDEGITINHYIKRIDKKDTLFELSNRETVTKEELDKIIEDSKRITRELSMNPMLGEYGMGESEGAIEESSEELNDEGDVDDGDEIVTLYRNGEPVRIENEREIPSDQIKHYLIAGDYILDEINVPANDLPIIFMDQNSFYEKDGKQVCRSFVIDAVDAQRYINYLGTQSAYVLKVSRYDQWIASKKNLQSLDVQNAWRNPFVIQGAIPYDESPNGNKPEQIRPAELPISLSQQYQRAIDDLYTSTGLYPARLGQQGNEVSGAAVDARTRQGSFNTFVAFNSVNRAISAGGKIVNQMIPRLFDTERVLTLMTPDEGRQSITLNKRLDEYGQNIENDITKGTFEVRLQAGPSYEGQKQQALDSLNMILQANPQLLNLFADLYAENLPLTNTIEIKNRLKTIVPPEIIEAGKSGKMPSESGQNQPTPEQQQAAMQQQQFELEAQFKQKEIAIKEQELQLKIMQMQAELEMERERLEAEKLEVAGQIEEQKLRYAAETQRTESDTSIAHANNLVKILTSKHPNESGGKREGAAQHGNTNKQY